MKRPIHTYTLNPGAGTLDLSGIPAFDVRNLFGVIHLPSGTLIYAPTAGQGYAGLSGGVLTLKVPVAAFGVADPLLVLYDDGGKPAEDASVQAVAAALGTPLATSPALGTAVEGGGVLQSLASLNLLATVAASSRLGRWYFQNQSGNPLYVALDDGAGNALSVFAVDPNAAGTGRQGGDLGHSTVGPHAGRIRVYGPASSQHSLRVS